MSGAFIIEWAALFIGVLAGITFIVLLWAHRYDRGYFDGYTDAIHEAWEVARMWDDDIEDAEWEAWQADREIEWEHLDITPDVDNLSDSHISDAIIADWINQAWDGDDIAGKDKP